jgi:hypothetical protein
MSNLERLIAPVCAGVFVILSVYVLALWIFAVIRTRFVFCYIFLVTGVLNLFICTINFILHIDPYVGVRLLGLQLWKIFYYAFLLIQPITFVISATGTTILVLWLIRKGLPNDTAPKVVGDLGSR